MGAPSNATEMDGQGLAEFPCTVEIRANQPCISEVLQVVLKLALRDDWPAALIIYWGCRKPLVPVERTFAGTQ